MKDESEYATSPISNYAQRGCPQYYSRMSGLQYYLLRVLPRTPRLESETAEYAVERGVIVDTRFWVVS